MNSPEIILGAIVLVPVVLLMLLRVNAALVFLSLCLGDVLVQFVAGDTSDFMALFHASSVTEKLTTTSVGGGSSLIKLILLLFPVVFTTVFMIHTVKGAKLVLNILPAAGVGLLGGLLVVPLLSGGLSHNIVSSPLWTSAQRAEDLIVGASALVCLLALWMQRPKTGGDEKHGKHHK